SKTSSKGKVKHGASSAAPATGRSKAGHLHKTHHHLHSSRGSGRRSGSQHNSSTSTSRSKTTSATSQNTTTTSTLKHHAKTRQPALSYEELLKNLTPPSDEHFGPPGSYAILHQQQR
ncbi:unnamed protein product, partial [Amoebophrya sp. A25]